MTFHGELEPFCDLHEETFLEAPRCQIRRLWSLDGSIVKCFEAVMTLSHGWFFERNSKEMVPPHGELEPFCDPHEEPCLVARSGYPKLCLPKDPSEALMPSGRSGRHLAGIWQRHSGQWVCIHGDQHKSACLSLSHVLELALSAGSKLD